jgi:hypothetical protein
MRDPVRDSRSPVDGRVTCERRVEDSRVLDRDRLEEKRSPSTACWIRRVRATIGVVVRADHCSSDSIRTTRSRLAIIGPSALVAARYKKLPRGSKLRIPGGCQGRVLKCISIDFDMDIEGLDRRAFVANVSIVDAFACG